MSIFNQPKTSIWGDVQDAKEIGNDVFLVSTATHGGIMIPAHISDGILSDKAIAMGVSQNGYLHYEEDGLKDIPLYELIKSNYITDNEALQRYNIAEMEADGHLFYPEYFGEFEPPKVTVWGDVAASVCFENGIYAVKSDSDVGMAVHKTAAFYRLSDETMEKGELSGDYICFDKSYIDMVIDEIRITNPGKFKRSQEFNDMLGISGPVEVELENNFFMDDEDEPEL